MKHTKKHMILPALMILLLLGAGTAVFLWFAVFSRRNAQTADPVFADPVSLLSGLEAKTAEKYTGAVEPLKTWEARKDSDLAEGEITADRLANDAEGYTSQLAALQAQKDKAPADKKLEIASQLLKVQNSLKKTQYDLSKQNAKNEKLKKSIENAAVLSGLTGIVQRADAGAEEVLVSVAETGRYHIRGTVSEQHLSALSEGSPVIIRSRDESGQTWRGTLTRIDLEAPVLSPRQDPKKVEPPVYACTYPFYVDPENTDGLLMGQHVFLEMDQGQEEVSRGLWLGEAYVLQEDGKAWVLAADPQDRLERRAVTLGRHNEALRLWEILDGLSPEDYLAFPSSKAVPGCPVQRNPVPAETSA